MLPDVCIYQDHQTRTGIKPGDFILEIWEEAKAALMSVVQYSLEVVIITVTLGHRLPSPPLRSGTLLPAPRVRAHVGDRNSKR